MLIQFRTSRLAGHGLYLRNGEQDFLRLTPNLVGLFQGDTRQRADIDGKRAFVERRQEAVAQRKEDAQGHHEHGNCTSQHRLLVLQRPKQGPFIIFLQPYRQEGFFRQAVSFCFSAQQVTAQHRGQGQCHHGGSKQRHDEGNAQRHQHTTFHPGQEEKRNKAHNDNQRGVQNRHTYLTRSIEHHLTYRLAFFRREHLVFPQVLPHVFHVDNGIVHQRTDGNGHTSQTHGIDAQSHVVQYQNGYYQGKRKGNQRNNRRTRIGQEQEKHDDHKDGAFIQRFLYVADGAFNEARLAEHIGRDFHILRQVLLQIGQCLLQLFRQGNRTRVGLLGYRKQYGWFSFFGSHSQFGLL